MSAYYNTTALSGRQLAAAHAHTRKQDEAVLAVCRGASGPLSPSQVWERCTAAGHRWPITSIRRAMTNLAAAGALVRLETQRAGIYGRPEHLWSLPRGQGELFG